MEGFLKRVKNLHNKELQLTSTQSQKFTEMLFNRPRDEEYNLAFFSKGKRQTYDAFLSTLVYWKKNKKKKNTIVVVR